MTLLASACRAASRPKAFVSTAGSGHALERLRRGVRRAPAKRTGGTPPPNDGAAVETRGSLGVFAVR